MYGVYYAATSTAKRFANVQDELIECFDTFEEAQAAAESLNMGGYLDELHSGYVARPCFANIRAVELKREISLSREESTCIDPDYATCWVRLAPGQRCFVRTTRYRDGRTYYVYFTRWEDGKLYTNVSMTRDGKHYPNTGILIGEDYAELEQFLKFVK